MRVKHKTLFTTRLSADREKKNLLFFKLIKSRKSTSRTEISKLTDINIVTVSNYVNSYIKKGLVAERGYDVSSGGRRPELIELNQRWGHVIGIDIGERRIKGCLMQLDREVLASESADINSEPGSEHVPSRVRNCIDKIIQSLYEASKAPREELRKIGIGVSSHSGVTPEILEIKEALEKNMNVPTLAGGAALCAASAERGLNSDADEAKSVLYMHGDLGEGVFIRDDEFYGAESSDAGFEQSSKPASELSDYLKPWRAGPGVMTEAVMEAARRNDEAASDLIKTAGVNLGVRVAYLANLFEPDSVIIGGGACEAGGLFLDSLKLSVDRFAMQRIKNKMRLAPAVSGRDACVKGACFLAIREALIEA